MNSISILSYIALALTIGYAFVYSAMGEVSALTVEREKYEQSLEMVSNIEIKKNELLSQFKNISETDKKNIDTVLPSSLNFVKLISEIDAVAARHGISIGKITYKEADHSVGDSIEEALPNDPYESAMIGFDFVASYEKLKDFVNDLEKSLRILDVKYLKVETSEDGLNSYGLEFETYWYKSSK